MLLEGKHIKLEEVKPKYFEKIIEWRNNSELNKYLNQPYTLTMKLQQKWYENYLNDFTQGLFIVVDLDNEVPFATIGYTDYDYSKNVCVVGRLLVGNLNYRGSEKWEEAILLFNDYIYNWLNVDNVFAHIVDENIASIKWHKKWGYLEQTGGFLFPNEIEVNGMRQKEYYRSKTMYYELFKQEWVL